MNHCVFSPDRMYRYVLRHDCGDLFTGEAKTIVWIGLNPSTADETSMDPTLQAVRRYSKKWGFSQIVMLNLFAFRATQPDDMKKAADPIGPDNNAHLLEQTKTADRIIACWGSHGIFMNRERDVCNLLNVAGVQLECLVKNSIGETPHHPLCVAADIEPIPFP